MSKSVLLGCALVALVAACAKKEDPVVYEPAPISQEPTYTGKYK